MKIGSKSRVENLKILQFVKTIKINSKYGFGDSGVSKEISAFTLRRDNREPIWENLRHRRVSTTGSSILKSKLMGKFFCSENISRAHWLSSTIMGLISLGSLSLCLSIQAPRGHRRYGNISYCIYKNPRSYAYCSIWHLFFTSFNHTVLSL